MPTRTNEQVPPPRVHLVSLGCAKNLVDSERLLGRLAAAGALVGAPADEADIIIVNTCGFIEEAKDESIQTILELARFKRQGLCRELLVIGCLSQRYAPILREKLTEADAFFGLGQDDAILAACGLRPSAGRDAGRLMLTPRHTTYIRIADGCDNRCAYCTIPIIRGPYRSREPGDILSETQNMVERGAREINLIAQDTTLYGYDLDRHANLPDLIRRIAAIRKVKWIRLLYTHPAHFSDELIDVYATTPKLCPYVDLPLQHFNDHILKRMGRKITKAGALELIDRIRQRIPGVVLRTTFLVGFPGETPGQFHELRDGVRELKFDHLGVFTYSREEGTRAARMRKHVSERVKARRMRDLMLTQQEIVFARNRALKGAAMQVVIEAPSAKDRWIARSKGQAPDVDTVTYVTGRNLRPGRFVNVTITGSQDYDLTARLARAARSRKSTT